MHLNERELRLAIHQGLDRDATKLVEKRAVSLRNGLASVDVHLYELDGHPEGSCCYVWSVVLSDARTIGPIVLKDRDIDTAAKAVASWEATHRPF